MTFYEEWCKWKDSPVGITALSDEALKENCLLEAFNAGGSAMKKILVEKFKENFEKIILSVR